MIIGKHNLEGSILFSRFANNDTVIGHCLRLEKTRTIITDGKLLIEIRNPNKQPSDFPTIKTKSTEEPINLEREFVFKLQEAFKKKDEPLQYAIIGKNGNSIELTTVDGKSHTLKVEDNNYPDTKVAYPEGEPQAEITFSFQLLKTLIKVVEKLSAEKEGITFKIYAKDKPARFDFKDNATTQVRGVICPMQNV